MPHVYTIRDDGSSEPMDRLRCQDEDRELQQLLDRNYNLLPGEQIDPVEPRRWLLIKREMPVPDPATGADRWSIDFFFVDQDAVPTLVECKRHDDTRSRREVVGQMLEYAANGHHYWTKELLRELAEATLRARGHELDAELAAIRPVDDLSVDTFFERVQDNLRQGQLRIVFFLEEAPMELRSVVDFLNKQMERSEVLLVEARQYAANGQRIVVPTLFGYTEQARLVKRTVTVSAPGTRRRWDRESFFADAAQRLPADDLGAVTAVFDAAARMGCELTWGTGRDKGSYSVKVPVLCQRSLLTVFSNGTLSLNFGWLNENDLERRVRDRLIELAVPALRLPPADYREQWKSLATADWAGRHAEVVRVLERLLAEFRQEAGSA